MRTHRWKRHLWMGLVIGCGLPATESDVKMAGVGLDPDSIGAIPTMHGGLVEYAVYDFAGGGLPLGMLGLTSYDEVGPVFASFKPPYRMVHGLGFVFQDDVMDPEALFGTLPPPPGVAGFCQTRYEPRSYISNVVDVGTRITFASEDGESGFSMGRRPFLYPPDMRDVITYYLEIDPWRGTPKMGPARLSSDDNDPGDLVNDVLLPANFPEGRLVSMTFPGGIPPREASIASIPVPLAAARSNTDVRLPHMPQGVRMTWGGPVYSGMGVILPSIGDEREIDVADADGAVETQQQIYDGVTWVEIPDDEASDVAKKDFQEIEARIQEMQGSYSTCLQYLSHEQVPAEVEDCLELARPPSNRAELDARNWTHLSTGQLEGQIYTAPWENDGLTFEWQPIETGEDEIVTLTVRFLGPVERDNENMVEAVVQMSPDDDVVKEELEVWWEELEDNELVPSGAQVPQGRRPALACDDDYVLDDPPILRDTDVEVEWPLESTLTDYRGDPVPSLQGDPGHTVAEVVCRLDESAGAFVLTQDVLEDAYAYAQMRGAEGSVFYFSRATSHSIKTPPVRDAYGHKHEISSLKVVSRAVQMGRFWYEQ
jgi:hypothetical protein